MHCPVLPVCAEGGGHKIPLRRGSERGRALMTGKRRGQAPSIHIDMSFTCCYTLFLCLFVYIYLL